MLENKNKNTPLNHATWKRLVELTSFISEDQFHHILNHLIGIQSLDQLSEERAIELIETLSVLPKLKSNLMRGLAETTENIVQNQMDIFAEQLIAGAGQHIDV